MEPIDNLPTKKRQRKSNYIKGGPQTEGYQLAQQFLNQTAHVPSEQRSEILTKICLREQTTSDDLMRVINSLPLAENDMPEMNKINDEEIQNEIHRLSDCEDYKVVIRFASNPNKTMNDYKKYKKHFEENIEKQKKSLLIVQYYENQKLKSRNNIQQLRSILHDISTKIQGN
mmetsp:Transcript_3611/g.3571  ORF Transcript_3611/g.3571 Transcript_3611/m.3571 type:complete len:172 (+) Transcript_3611:341-856(+)